MKFSQKVEFTEVSVDEMTSMVHCPHQLNTLQIQLACLTAVQ